MRDAETVLGVIRDRGSRGLPLEDIYRQLYNRELYLRAYGRLYSNQGAMTPGTTADTVDGMSLARIDAVIDALRHERYRWTPVRRVYIPKANGKTRPLGIPTWSDKLLQEVIRMILEAYYEPQFSDCSHGFRPGRGCHTALNDVATRWTGVHWFIEGDIKGCFDNLNHCVLMSILREKLHDNRFLRLIENLLRAGYLEDWRYGETPSGTPQGGVVSPILSNLYLDRLDRFVEKVLIPGCTRGQARRSNPTYRVLQQRARYHGLVGHHDLARIYRKEMQRLPTGDPYDPGFRRLRYVRYADDFLLGLIGPRTEAEEIKQRLSEFLQRELRLELSQDKTLITNATASAARFLGYGIVNQQADDKQRNGRREVNGGIGLRVPADVIERHCRRYMRNGKPAHRNELLFNDDFTIIDRYQSEFRGVVQYYLLASNVSHLGRLKWVMQQSLAKTLAAKHKMPRRRLIRKYQTTTRTKYGTLACLKVVVERSDGKPPLVAQFGGIPLRRKRQAVLVDSLPLMHRGPGRSELVKRLLADECELCGSTLKVEVHHVRKLKDLNIKGRRLKPKWMETMAALRRKTLVVCRICHMDIHHGRLPSESGNRPLESRMR